MSRQHPTQGQLDVLENSFDCLPIASISVTESGHILQINQRCISLLGLPTRQHFINQNWFEIVNPPNFRYKPGSPTFYSALQVCNKQDSWSGPIQITQRSINENTFKTIVVQLQIQKTYFRDENDFPRTFFTCTMEENHQVNADVQRIVDSMPIGFSIWRCVEKSFEKGDPQFILLSINNAAEKILGISVPIGSRLDDTVDPNSNPLVREFFRDILIHQQTVFRPRFALGRNVFGLTAFPMPGNCFGLILEPCRVKDESLQSLDQSTTPFGILCSDEFLSFDYANFGLLALSGYDLEEIREKPLRDIVIVNEKKEEDVAALNSFLDDITSNKRGSTELRFLSKSHTEYTALLQYIPMKDSTGRTFRYILFFHVY